MSWINGIVKSAVVGTALLAAGTAVAATLVVRSNGPSASAYPPGKALAPGSSITLKAGDSVTVLDAGGTRVLKGPGVVAVSSKGAASANGISALIATTGVRQTRTGATRGRNSGPPHATNVWYIDASRSGTVCVVDAKSAVLWRPGNSVADTIKLTSLGDGKSVSLDFRAGQTVRNWPVTDLPLFEGASFKLESAGSKSAVSIKSTLVAAPPSGLDGTAQALLDKGCAAQVDLLIVATAQ